MNPYESGAAAPAIEAIERQHWATLGSGSFALISFTGLLTLFGYIFSIIDQVGVPGFSPNTSLAQACAIAWGLGSVLGSIVGAIGYFRSRDRRVLALTCLLANLFLALALAGVTLIGLTLGR